MSISQQTLSPADLAALFSFDFAHRSDSDRHLDEWFRTDPRLAETVARLEETAQAAGYGDLTPDNLARGHETLERLEQLVAAEIEDWDYPEEILDPDVGYAEDPWDLRQLYCLLAARIARTEGGRRKRRLEEIRDKLRRTCREKSELEPPASPTGGPATREATARPAELSLEEIVEIFARAENAAAELEWEVEDQRQREDFERSIRRARWLRGDPRVAEHVRRLEEMAADAGIDRLAQAFRRHRDLDELLAGGEIGSRHWRIENFVEIGRVIAARLARSRGRRERQNLRRVREYLRRLCSERIRIDFDGEVLSLEELAGHLTEMPEVAQAFVEPFRRLFTADSAQA